MRLQKILPSLLLAIGVACIETKAESVIATIPVNEPNGIAVNFFTHRVYVADSGGLSSGTVRVIDERTNQVTDTIVTTGNSVGVAVNIINNLVYVTDYSNGLLDVVDGYTNQLITTVPVTSSPGAVAINIFTNKIYVSDRFQSAVTIVDGATNTVITSLSVISPEEIGINEATNLIYVAGNPRFTQGQVTVIDGDSDEVVTTILTDRMTTGIAVNQFTNTIYATNHDSGTVSVIDGNSNTAIDTLNLGQLLAADAVDLRTGRLYVNEAPFYPNRGAIAVIDGSTDEVLSTVEVGNLPVHISLDPFSRRAYVSNFQSGSVSVLSLEDENEEPWGAQ